MRLTREVSRSVQDGLKTKFLCLDCEQKFGKYETKFADSFYQKY